MDHFYLSSSLPLVWQGNDSCLQEAWLFHHRKVYGKSYCKTIQWIWCKLSYSLLCSAPSCAYINPGPHNTTLLIIQSLETPMTFPAHWDKVPSQDWTLILYCFYHVLSALMRLPQKIIIQLQKCLGKWWQMTELWMVCVRLCSFIHSSKCSVLMLCSLMPRRCYVNNRRQSSLWSIYK